MPLRQLFCLGALLALVAACSSPPATPTPQAVVSPTAVPPVSPSPAVPTSHPLSGLAGRLTLWHPFGTDTAPELAVRDVLDQLRAESPAVEIEVLQFPPDQIEAKFITRVDAGQPPDVLIASDDILRRAAAAGLIALAPHADVEPQAFIPAALDALTVDGELVGLPIVVHATLLFYDREALASTPASRDELVAAAGRGLVVSARARDLLPWMIDTGGTAEPAILCANQGASAAAWLESLGQLAGLPEVTFWHDQAPLGDALFRTGRAAMLIDTSRELPRYRDALGERLAIAPLPGAPEQITVDGVAVRAGSANPGTAWALAQALGGRDTADAIAQAGGYLPARAGVVSSDALVGDLAAIAAESAAQPALSVGTRAFDMAFDPAVIQVVEGGAGPAAAARSACAALGQ